ncbi:MAG: class I SAM-dependent methyltransferase [Candidatus Rokuibacteriota bacterium]
MGVDPFFNDRKTIDVFERSFYASAEAAEEVEEILTWRALPRRVLDIGCNAGLHALEWARQGADVVGIDSAPVAIELARQRAGTQPAARFEVADLLEARLDRWGTFDLVTALGGVFNCLERGDLVPTFRAVAAALAPGGDFVFDVLKWFDGRRRTFLRRNGRGDLKIVWEFSLDPTRGRGRVVGHFLETGVVQDSERAFYTIPEITTLLELAGLARLGVAGDLAFSASPDAAEPSTFFRAARCITPAP